MERRYLLLCLFILCSALLLSGCKTVPVFEPVSPIPTQENLKDKEIELAIIRAGAITNWAITSNGPGAMTGTLQVRGKHTAVVDITYTKSEYRILYRHSDNLKYKDGKIHRNYNKWVTTLDSNIRRELTLVNRYK